MAERISKETKKRLQGTVDKAIATLEGDSTNEQQLQFLLAAPTLNNDIAQLLEMVARGEGEHAYKEKIESMNPKHAQIAIACVSTIILQEVTKED